MIEPAGSATSEGPSRENWGRRATSSAKPKVPEVPIVVPLVSQVPPVEPARRPSRPPAAAAAVTSGSAGEAVLLPTCKQETTTAAQTLPRLRITAPFQAYNTSQTNRWYLVNKPQVITDCQKFGVRTFRVYLHSPLGVMSDRSRVTGVAKGQTPTLLSTPFPPPVTDRWSGQT